jgi:phosphomannomutase
MMAEYFLQKHPGSSIIYDARNSRSVHNTIEKHGGTPVRTKVGHSNIKLVMRDSDAPFGGEASGHFYFRDNWYADSGLIAAVIGLYIATLSGKKLSQLREQYTHYAAIQETNFVVEDKDAAIQAVEALFPDAKFDTLDGLTVNLPNHTWLNIRASNTEPVLRLNAEAPSQSELDAVVSKVTAIFNG